MSHVISLIRPVLRRRSGRVDEMLKNNLMIFVLSGAQPLDRPSNPFRCIADITFENSRQATAFAKRGSILVDWRRSLHRLSHKATAIIGMLRLHVALLKGRCIRHNAYL